MARGASKVEKEREGERDIKEGRMQEQKMETALRARVCLQEVL